jgi:uncharacterized OsmC-like protein
MWLLNFLPDWFFHALLLIGVLGYASTFLIRFLPSFVYMYKLPIQLVSIAIMAGSVFMIGAISEREAWEARVKEMEEKVRLAEQKAQEENERIEVKVVEKTKVIKEKGRTQIEYINRLVKGDTVEIVKDMSEEERQKFLAKQKELQDAVKNCPIPKIIVEEHNKAADIK